MSFEIAKAGWLFRESSILRRWKKNWFVLYHDGMIKYFESPDSHTAEEAESIPRNCISMKLGSQVTNVTPPDGHGFTCLLSLLFAGHKTWTLCAESPDDASAWELAIREARGMRPAASHHSVPPPPYQAVPTMPHNGYYPAAGVRYVYPDGRPIQGHPYAYQGADGQTVIIVEDNRRRGVDGMDMATGMMAGAALGSMMWWPLLWW